MKRDEIDTRNSGEQLIYQTDSQLKELADKISDEHKAMIDSKKEDLESTLKDGNTENIKLKIEDLNKAWSDIYQQMSAQQQSDPGNGQGDDPSSANKGGETVEDADFEVVNDEDESKK